MLKEKFENSENQIAELKKVNAAVDNLYTLWKIDSNPTLINILKEINRSGLFKVPDSLATIADRQEKDFELPEGDIDLIIDAWDAALASSFNELKSYVQYISEESRFGTHQGIKGLEFPRVMVILDDGESRGNSFSYEKLLGAKEPAKSDNDNQKKGKETSIDRTRRLFYVTCSRTEESLAIIAYTSEPDKVKENALRQGWFTEEEIVTL